VRQGLAYFTLRIKSLTKMAGPTGNSTVPTVSKGEAIFDLKSGMWLESKTKSETRMKMPGAGADMRAVSVSKMRMEVR